MTDPSLAYLLTRVRLVEDRIRELVLHRRADDPAPDDPFRGLYLTEEGAHQLLSDAAPPPAADHEARQSALLAAEELEKAGLPVRLRSLVRAAELSELDEELLLCALVPDLDSRYERLYGYLNDDVTRRRATVGLALALADAPAAQALARSRLSPGAPLVDRGLVLVEDPDRPFLTRALRVPDRVAAHLLGDDTPDRVVSGYLLDVPAYGSAQADAVGHALSLDQKLFYIKENVTRTGTATAVAALAQSGRSALAVDLDRIAATSDAIGLIVLLGREAMLRGAGIVAAPIESLAETGAEALRKLAQLEVPVLIVGSRTWDPEWSESVPLVVDAPHLSTADRELLWSKELEAVGGRPELASVTGQFVLGPGQVVRAVRAATAASLLNTGELNVEDVRRGALAQNAAGLERLARRVEPQVGWDDIVLPEPVMRQLHDLAVRARHRDLVLTEWRMRRGGGRGSGVSALFAGDSGTGKTMAAEVIASVLGLDLYTVNLATVVDKYVGETEKNLERIFSEAGGVNAVLLFDEADAVFGKRSEVRDAHDRYANIESAYLLQRMETFDGLAILSTNLRANIDEAFTRRLDTIIDFPSPDETARLALWKQCLAPPLPCADDLDLEFCARAFTLSGGNIRSAAITAAYQAAGDGRPIGMTELIWAVQQEYRKLGRLVLEREFGPYLVPSGVRSVQEGAGLPGRSGR